MADSSTIRQRVPTRTRALSLGGVIAGHVALAIGLVAAIQIPHLIEPPPIEVSLVPALQMPAPSRPKPQPRTTETPPRRAPEVAPRQARIVGPEKVVPLPLPAAPTPPISAADREKLLAAPFAPKEGAARGLRTSTGCDETDAKLSTEEREKCRQRTHDLRANAPVYAVGPSDPKKRAYLDKQAAKNEARRLQMEAPPSPPTTGCPTGSRFSNLGFSCVP